MSSALSNAALNRTEAVLTYLKHISATMDTALRVLGVFPEHKELSGKILTAQTMVGLAIIKARDDLSTETR